MYKQLGQILEENDIHCPDFIVWQSSATALNRQIAVDVQQFAKLAVTLAAKCTIHSIVHTTVTVLWWA